MFFEPLLSFQEMNGIFILHAQKIKRMLDLQEQAEKMRDLELQELRNELVAAKGPKKASGPSQLEHCKKLLVERDTACRLAEAENFQLREQLAAMRALGNQTLIMKTGSPGINASTISGPVVTGVSSPMPISAAPTPLAANGVSVALGFAGAGATPGALLGPAPAPATPMVSAPLNAPEVLNRLERAQTVLETWASTHHPQLGIRKPVGQDDEDEASSDSEVELPGAVRGGRRKFRGDLRVSQRQPEQSENEEEEAVDPKAEYLKESQKQRKKKMLNSKLRALDMKTRMRDAFAEPSYIATEHYHTTGCAQKLARSPYFEHTTMTIILLNSVWIGIESTINESALLINADPGIIVVENMLCIAFSFEIIVRFFAFKSKLRALRDFWFIYDFFLAFFMVLETWVFFVILSATGGDLVLFGPQPSGCCECCAPVRVKCPPTREVRSVCRILNSFGACIKPSRQPCTSMPLRAPEVRLLHHADVATAPADPCCSDRADAPISSRGHDPSPCHRSSASISDPHGDLGTYDRLHLRDCSFADCSGHRCRHQLLQHPSGGHVQPDFSRLLQQRSCFHGAAVLSG